ncbi:helix-turn-helix transcriptional regulator [Limnohabitans sp.]|uniref:helix-turn-helix transcriptional regulator n=1 Tax=Limnohabitans sp. TaxID=1907725 RepID=UPI0038B9FFA4
MLLSMQKLSAIKRGRPVGSRTFDPASAHAFGEAVREYRLLIGLSQEELGNRALVERSHMGKIERGEHLPNLVLILRLAQAMDMKPGVLVDRTVELLETPASSV